MTPVDFRELAVANERLIHQGDDVWLFLDDVPEERRPATAIASSWIRVTDAWSCVGLLELLRGRVAGLDLDHDLSVAQIDGARLPTGYDVVRHLVERWRADALDLWPSTYLCVHAATPTGRDRMVGAIETVSGELGFVRESGAALPTWRRAGPTGPPSAFALGRPTGGDT